MAQSFLQHITTTYSAWKTPTTARSQGQDNHTIAVNHATSTENTTEDHRPSSSPPHRRGSSGVPPESTSNMVVLTKADLLSVIEESIEKAQDRDRLLAGGDVHQEIGIDAVIGSRSMADNTAEADEFTNSTNQ
jgi:hypothetical protein